MKYRHIHILLIFLLINISCGDKILIINCEDCLISEPVKASITIKLSTPVDYNISLTLFEGPVDDNVVLSTTTVYSERAYFSLQINKIYSCMVTYTDRLGIKYIATGSVYPKVKLDLEQCTDFPCYYIYDNELDLRLKYD